LVSISGVTAVKRRIMSAPRTTACCPHSLQEQLEATSRGEVSAFADLFQTLAPRIYGLVLRILKDPHQAEEVTQEIFLEIWRTAVRFDPARGSAQVWVMTMAHHRAVDRVRAAQTRRRLDTADAERKRETPYDVTAAAALAFLDARTVRAALATLPPAKRAAIELAYFDGHTYNEVAQIMHIPLGTAKTRIRDGLIRLRDELTTEASQPDKPSKPATAGA
jgi:RNA polymerase sigma-70 factor, ECF subfamily